MIKVLSIFGTRPEAIKMAPLIKKLEENKDIANIVCVTAQHREMLDQVLEVFDIKPDYDLNIMKQGQTLSDITTRALLGLNEVLLKENLYGDILDVGCGYGVIGIILSSFFNNKINSVSMVDVNLRAIHLTKMNIKENKVNNCNAFISNVYENIDKKYDFIITNPPKRAGNDIVYKILKEAKDYLKENGCLYYVINKNQGALSSIKEMEKISKVEVLEKNKGFYIIKCIF